ncbi:zinc protease [Bacteroidia bacterium]|nr:zinc protease [Bacteroidia bacterium]
MITFTKTTLKNGLTVLCHTDKGTPFVCVNVLYKVGSRNESENRTGLAHLFEHLMFGGSVNVPDYDYEIQMAGGENNAYTTFDYTNYYVNIPATNIETALWLESDRMFGLNLSPEALEVQRNVVIEEFKQRYLNVPYGDVWLHLRPLAYKKHPYAWPVIGKTPEHIETATLEEVTAFYKRFYSPTNAIISISGNIDNEKAFQLVEKWFADIPSPQQEKQISATEPTQTEERRTERNNKELPADAIYKVFHTGGRFSDNYYACDLISDILSNGQSSRLYCNLVKERGLFSSIDAYVTGEFDTGLFVFSGKISQGIKPEIAEQGILEEIENFIRKPITERELQKVINKTEARIKYEEISYQNKASNLALFEALGNADLVNHEAEIYGKIKVADLQETAANLFKVDNSTTLLYLK